MSVLILALQLLAFDLSSDIKQPLSSYMLRAECVIEIKEAGSPQFACDMLCHSYPNDKECKL